MEGRRAQEQGADYRAIRRGWCLGREQFGKELLAAAASKPVQTTTGRTGRRAEKKRPSGWCGLG